MIQEIVILILFFAVQAFIYNCSTVLACLVCRLPIERVGIFFGKPIFTIQTKYFPISIGFIPTGGYVKHDVVKFSECSFLNRMTVILSGPLIALLSAFILLGDVSASRQLINGFSEIFRGGIAPYEQGVLLIRAFFRVADHSLFLAYGIFVSKLTALSLLPLSGFVGGRILGEVAGPQRKFRYPNLLSALNAFVIFPLVVCWGLALISYFRHR